MKYAEYDNAEGKHGGPFLNELAVLEREKINSSKDEREPQYQLVLDELYSGNLPTTWEQQPEIKDENGVVLNPEAKVWEPLDHDSVVYDEANSPVKQQAREAALQERMLKEYGEDATKTPFGNVGNQTLDESAAPEKSIKQENGDSVFEDSPTSEVADDHSPTSEGGKPGKVAAKKAVAAK